MGSNPKSHLSPGQIVQKCYNEAEDRIRVDAQYTTNLTGEIEVSISAPDDTIAISDGTDILQVNSDGSINTSLPPGAATEAKQDVGNTSLSSIDTKLTATNTKLDTLHSDLIVVEGKQDTGNTSLSSIDSKLTNSSQKTQIVDGSGNVVGPEQTISGTNYLPVVQASSATSGSAVASRSTQIAGSDGTNARTISTDTTGKVNINNVSGTISLPTGAATAANQTTANTSLASIDSKLTAPLSVTQVELSDIWSQHGYVATAATTRTQIMASAFSYQPLNDALVVQSSSADDALAGTGAQKILITWFAQDGSGPFYTTVNMNGTTIIFAGISPAFIQSAIVSQCGSGGTNAGTILLSGLSPLATMAAINPGDSETYYAHHIVPLGKTAYLTDFSCAGTPTTAGRSCEFIIKKQGIALASHAQLSVISRQKFAGTSSTQTTNLKTPISISGPAIILVFVEPDSATADTWYTTIVGYEK